MEVFYWMHLHFPALKNKQTSWEKNGSGGKESKSSKKLSASEDNHLGWKRLLWKLCLSCLSCGLFAIAHFCPTLGKTLAPTCLLCSSVLPCSSDSGNPDAAPLYSPRFAVTEAADNQVTSLFDVSVTPQHLLTSFFECSFRLSHEWRCSSNSARVEREREAVHGRNWGVWEGGCRLGCLTNDFLQLLETVQTCIHSLRRRSATAGRWPAFGGIQGAYVTVNLSCLTWILLRDLDPINKNHSLFMQVGFFKKNFIWICADVGSPAGHNHMNHPFSSSPYIPKPPSSQALVDPFSLFSPLLFSSSLDSGRIAHFVNFFPRNHVAQLDFQWLRSFTEVPRHLGECCFSTSWMEPRQPWSRARKETLLVAAPRPLMLPFNVCSWWRSFQTGESNAENSAERTSVAWLLIFLCFHICWFIA